MKFRTGGRVGMRTRNPKQTKKKTDFGVIPVDNSCTVAPACTVKNCAGKIPRDVSVNLMLKF
jgi:hypothetical protein